MELEQLQKHYDTIRTYGVRLYAVSVASPDQNRALSERVGTGFTFLSDPDGRLLDQLNISHTTPNPTGKDIPIPTQILVDKSGVVRWIYQPPNYRIRARPETVLKAIKDLSVTQK